MNEDNLRNVIAIMKRIASIVRDMERNPEIILISCWMKAKLGSCLGKENDMEKLWYEECEKCEEWKGYRTHCCNICMKPFDAMDEFNEYKRLEEQGLLLRLPCKVGDTVYTACSWGIESGVVGGIEIISDMIFVNNIHGAMIGEVHNIFLTREEAESALKKMRGEEHEIN